MKCIICGNEISGYGNNPHPLCHRSSTARCCDDCNNLVLMARLSQFREDSADEISVERKVAILYSTNSDKPTEYLTEQGKILYGIVKDIKGNKAYGTWGNFELNLEEDNYYVTRE